MKPVYTEEELKSLQSAIEDCCLAEELFGLDELERCAAAASGLNNVVAIWRAIEAREPCISTQMLLLKTSEILGVNTEVVTKALEDSELTRQGEKK